MKILKKKKSKIVLILQKKPKSPYKKRKRSQKKFNKRLAQNKTKTSSLSLKTP